MAIQLKMSLKLSQNLRMTPQLQQAIRMLQLTKTELEVQIRKEINENPLLEEFQDTVEDDPSADLSSISQEKDKSSEDQDPRSQDESEWKDFSDVQYSGFSNSSLIPEGVNYDNFISKNLSLKDHLTWQAGLSGFDEMSLNIVSLILSYIDDNGYIKASLEKIAQENEVDLEELESLLPSIQEFDPPGVGCRDLKECLIIQACHFEEDTKDVIFVIENHLKDLENKNYLDIAKSMNLEVEEVIEICKIILSFDPKPGRAFQSEETYYVVPDVYVYKTGSGSGSESEYAVTLNEEGIPKLKISGLYKDMTEPSGQKNKNKENKEIKKTQENKDTKEYLEDRLKSAIWLIRAIQQRQRTIYKVTESIVRQQKDFFDKGSAYIKPMVLRHVAEDIGMHESTVSRVTTSKYVHTPQGLFELKYFFNSGITKTDGDTLASESVRLKIKDFVSQENQKKPLSDQKIVDLLNKEGIQIARRTVAKYRETLRILPSSKRKKFF